MFLEPSLNESIDWSVNPRGARASQLRHGYVCSELAKRPMSAILGGDSHKWRRVNDRRNRLTAPIDPSLDHTTLRRRQFQPGIRRRHFVELDAFGQQTLSRLAADNGWSIGSPAQHGGHRPQVEFAFGFIAVTIETRAAQDRPHVGLKDKCRGCIGVRGNSTRR